MFNLVVGILDYENIPYEPITDLEVEWRGTERQTPSDICGVFVFPDDPEKKHIVTDYYEVIDYIRLRGLTPC